MNHKIVGFSTVSVYVLGDVMLDSYVSGDVTRISPEAPVQVLSKSCETRVLGGAANVAANIAALGGTAFLCGRIGNDIAGRELANICTERGIKTNFIYSINYPTTHKMRFMSGSQQLIRVDEELVAEPNDSDVDAIIFSFQKFVSIAGSKALVISDYGKGLLTKSLVHRVIKIANAAGIPIVTDPKFRDFSHYRGSTIIKPNLKEGRAIVSKKFGQRLTELDFEDEVQLICKQVLEESKSECVVLSLSEYGVAVKSKSDRIYERLQSQALQVSDVSGAGDTMIACLAMGIACGLSFVESAEIANVAAAVVCGKLGTATVNLVELIEAFRLKASRYIIRKLMTFDEVVSVATHYRTSHKRIVFTNGCFDILHAGHIQLLRNARELGDFLIVGLNSDSSIRRIKGAGRPVQSQIDRAKVLEAMDCVDAIVIFEGDTPSDLIRCIKPDVLVKGGDYSKDQVIGAQMVEKSGGQVQIVPLVEGLSTTNIVERVLCSRMS